jgi:hypothetical protein
MPRSLPVAVAVFVLLAWCLGSGLARADPPTAKTVPLYVLAIWTEDSDDQADALTKALRWRVRQEPRWALLETSQSFETLAIALKCPPTPDPACLLRIGDQLKADHYVWGTMDRKGTPGEVSAEMHLWIRARPSVEADQAFTDTLKDAGEEPLRVIAANIFDRLTGTGSASIAASASPIASASAESAVEATVAPVQPLANPAPAPAPAAQPFPARKALAYSALALGAGFLVVGAVETAKWISDGNASTDDRQSVPRSVTDVCADVTRLQAVDACSKSKDAVTASTVAWIFAGVGAALAGTGVWLIATDHGTPNTPSSELALAVRAPRLEFLPSIEPRAGRLDVRVTF